jgi:hypothetical protein
MPLDVTAVSALAAVAKIMWWWYVQVRCSGLQWNEGRSLHTSFYRFQRGRVVLDEKTVCSIMIEFTVPGRCKAHGLNNRMDVVVLFRPPDSLLITSVLRENDVWGTRCAFQWKSGGRSLSRTLNTFLSRLCCVVP